MNAENDLLNFGGTRNPGGYVCGLGIRALTTNSWLAFRSSLEFTHFWVPTVEPFINAEP